MPAQSQAAIVANNSTEAAKSFAINKPILTKAGAARISAHCAYHFRNFVLAHSVGLALTGGLLAGFVAYRLAKKFRFSKADTAE